MEKFNSSLLFLGKEGDPHCQRALDFCVQNFKNVTHALGVWKQPFPNEAANWQGDYIVSYLSRWVVPAALLQRAKKAAINFHPASPSYPGIGCNNFALYENAVEYGATCHHMEAKVDTGEIIAVKLFPVFPTDDVASLLSRTYDFQLALFYEVISEILQSKPLPRSDLKWTRAPYTRKEFDQLGRITPEMSREEIDRRIRACKFGSWRPRIELQGHTFDLK